MAHRVEKVNQLIRRELSELLQRQVRDPRLGSFISVNEVRTSADLKHARVFVSSFGKDVDRPEVLAALKTASGFFRGELGSRLKLRSIPELSFSWDESIEQGAYLLRLIDQVTGDTGSTG